MTHKQLPAGTPEGKEPRSWGCLDCEYLFTATDADGKPVVYSCNKSQQYLGKQDGCLKAAPFWCPLAKREPVKQLVVLSAINNFDETTYSLAYVIPNGELKHPTGQVFCLIREFEQADETSSKRWMIQIPLANLFDSGKDTGNITHIVTSDSIDAVIAVAVELHKRITTNKRRS